MRGISSRRRCRRFPKRGSCLRGAKLCLGSCVLCRRMHSHHKLLEIRVQWSITVEIFLKKCGTYRNRHEVHNLLDVIHLWNRRRHGQYVCITSWKKVKPQSASKRWGLRFENRCSNRSRCPIRRFLCAKLWVLYSLRKLLSSIPRKFFCSRRWMGCGIWCSCLRATLYLFLAAWWSLPLFFLFLTYLEIRVMFI